MWYLDEQQEQEYCENYAGEKWRMIAEFILNKDRQKMREMLKTINYSIYSDPKLVAKLVFRSNSRPIISQICLTFHVCRKIKGYEP